MPTTDRDSSRTDEKTPSLGFLTVLVVISGFCSLVYQVVWDRTIRYNFGGDNTSAAIVTATFLLGLGIGAYLFGRWRAKAFLVYSLVEFSIGVYAILSFYVMSPLGPALASAFDTPITAVEGLRVPIVLACILTLLPPCILMGASLPLMFNCFIRPGAYRSRSVGWIYGWNTAGAALGTVAAPLLFLNHLSIPTTLLLVGILNIFLAAGIRHYGRLMQQDGEADATEPAPAAVPAAASAPSAVAPAASDDEIRSGTSRALLGLSFISGFLVLAYEISLFRHFYVVYPSLPYNFVFVLAPFLISLAVGSVLFTRFRRYTPGKALGRVGILLPLSAVSMLGAVSLGAEDLLSGASRLKFLPGSWTTLHCVLLCMLPPLLAGGVFPLLLRVSASRGRSLPRQTGVLYLANSVGAFVGALLIQFVGFTSLGTRGVFFLLFFAGLAAGLWALVATASRLGRMLLVPVAALAVLPFLLSTLTFDIYRFGHTPARAPEADWIGIEGRTGVATIEWRAARGTGVVRVNGQKMALLPHSAVDIAVSSLARSVPEYGRVLVLGLGGGSTVRDLVSDPTVRQIDVIDWSHELPQVLSVPRAKDMLDHCLDDPRVRLFNCDARVAVSLYAEDSFDVIIDNLSIPGWTGSTSVKSTSYFEMIRRILEPDGLFVYRNFADVRETILAGLTRSFGHVQRFNFQIATCSTQPLRTDLQLAQALLTEVEGTPEVPTARWELKLRETIDPAAYRDVAPIRDELLIHEYSYHPFSDTNHAAPE